MAITPAISTHVASGATAPVMVILDALEASSFGSAAEKLSAAYRWIIIDPDGRSYVYHNPVQGILCEIAGDWTLRLQILPDGETAWLEDEDTFTVAAESWDFEYHVSGDGSDSTGDGSEATPFATVKKAFDTAVAGGATAGDRVRIRVEKGSDITESAAPSWSGTGIALCIDTYGDDPPAIEIDQEEIETSEGDVVVLEEQVGAHEHPYPDGDSRPKIIVPGNWLVDTGIDSTAASGLILRDVRIFESDPTWVAGRAAVDLSAASDDPAATGHNLLVIRCLFDVPEAFDIRTTDATVASGKVTGVGNIGIFHTEFVRSNGTILVAEQLHAVDTWFHDCHVKAAADGLDAESFWRFGVTGCRFLAPIQVLDARDPVLTLSTTSRRIVVSDNWFEVDAATVLSIESSAEGAWVARNYTRPREGTLSNTFDTWLAFAGDGLVCCSNALRHSQAGTIVSLAVGPAETSKSAIVANNSVRMSAASGTSALVAQEADLVGLVSSLAIKNNALESTAAGTVILLHTEETALLGTVDLDHNSLDQNTAWVFDAEANDAVSLATLQATYDLEEHAVVETAPIANPIGGDWRPTAALRGAGTPLAAAKADRNGGTRHGDRWDIGSDANGITDFWHYTSRQRSPTANQTRWFLVTIPRAQAVGAGLTGGAAQIEGRPDSRAYLMADDGVTQQWGVLDVSTPNGSLATLVPDASGQNYRFEFHQGFAIQDCGAAPVFNDRLLPRAWIRVGGSNNLFEQRNTANLELVDESPIHRRYYYKSRGPHGFWQHYYVLVWTNQDMGSLGQRGAIAEFQSYVPWHEWDEFSPTFDVDQIGMQVGHEVDMHYAAALNVVASYSTTALRTNVTWNVTNGKMVHGRGPVFWGQIFARTSITDPSDESMFDAARGNMLAGQPMDTTLEGHYTVPGWSPPPEPVDTGYGSFRQHTAVAVSGGMTDQRPSFDGRSSRGSVFDWFGHAHMGPVLRTRQRPVWEWWDLGCEWLIPRMGGLMERDGRYIDFDDYNNPSGPNGFPDWVTLGTSYDGGRGLAYDFRGRTMHGKGAVRDEMFWPDAWHPGERIDFHSKSHMDLLFLDRYFVSRDPVFGPLLETFVSRLRADIRLYQFSDTSRAAGRPLIWAARAFYTRPDVRAKIVDYASREVNRQYQEWPGHRIPAGRPVRPMSDPALDPNSSSPPVEMGRRPAYNPAYHCWGGLGIALWGEILGNQAWFDMGMAVLRSCFIYGYMVDANTGLKQIPFYVLYAYGADEGLAFTEQQRTEVLPHNRDTAFVVRSGGHWTTRESTGALIFFRDRTSDPNERAIAQELIDVQLINGKPGQWRNQDGCHANYAVTGPLRRP